MEFKGKVIGIRCHKENGWGVFLLSNGREQYIVTGTIDTIDRDDYIYVEGELITNKFGEQIKATIIKQELPSNVNTFASYLMKNIYGLGVVTANAIVSMFRENTFDVIANKPEKLVKVKGISKKKADDISAQFVALNSSREEKMFFINLGISDAYAGRIKKAYADGDKDFKDIIKENPYQLIKDIEGIGFKKADEIAEKVGITKDSPYRIKSGIVYVMDELTNAKGNVCYPSDMLTLEAARILGVSRANVAEQLVNLIADEELFIENDMIYLSDYYAAENKLAKNIVEILSYKSKQYNDDVVINRIKKIEKENNTELDESQRNAVLNAIQNNVTIITGGPGTGKTTTVNIFIKYLLCYETTKEKILLAAPTGRAAKRMEEQTKMPAKTMHRLLGLTVNDNKSKQNGYSKNTTTTKFESFNDEFDDELEDYKEEEYNELLSAHTIIIDEMSMVDLRLMNEFISSVKQGTKIVLIGDADQLPSVGPGTVLKDMIESGIVSVSKLTKIHRQAKDSHIIQNAHKINNGEYIDLKEQHDDFFFAGRKSEESMISTIKLLLTEKIPKRYNIDSFDVQILAPQRKGTLGVNNLNNIIQEFVNPPSIDKVEIKMPLRNVTFREGDKVIHIKNNYGIKWSKETKKPKKIKNMKRLKKFEDDDDGSGVFNGEIGKITNINLEDRTISIKYEDRVATYSQEDLDEVELAYATTIHKSQGSEYPAIIIPLLTSGVKTLYNRNLLYTAVTRAKDCVAILGNNQVVYQMIQNTESQVRYTQLASKLKEVENDATKVGKKYA